MITKYKMLFPNLPIELNRKILSYDNTYKNIFDTIIYNINQLPLWTPMCKQLNLMENKYHSERSIQYYKLNLKNSNNIINYWNSGYGRECEYTNATYSMDNHYYNEFASDHIPFIKKHMLHLLEDYSLT